MSSSEDLLVGFDVGGTKALGVAITPSRDRSTQGIREQGDFEVITSARGSSAGDGDALTQTLATLTEQLLEDVTNTNAAAGTNDQARPAHIGLAVAGLADRSGVLRYSPNLPDIIEYPLVASLQAELDRRLDTAPTISLDNDATAGTWAEAHLGAGRGQSDFIFVTLGTGIGTGIVAGGRLVRGANGYAGEAGHMVVDASGAEHITGVAGPWELFASGIALRHMGRDAAAAGRFDAGIELAGSAEAVTSHNVHDAVAAGDAQALVILDEYCAQVALGIANLVMIMDPARVIIGGGVSEIGEPLRTRIEALMPRVILGHNYRPMPDVVLAQLGAEANAIGAALMTSELFS